MSKLREAIQTLCIWVDMWSDKQSEREELNDCDSEERKVIAAARFVMKAIPDPEDYVAWLRFNGHTFETCDSDSPGAFRVCRHPDDLTAAKPQGE